MEIVVSTPINLAIVGGLLSIRLLFEPPAPGLGALVQEFAGQFLQGFGGVLAHLGGLGVQHG